MALQTFNSLSEKFGYRRVNPEEVDSLRHLTTLELMKHLGVRRLKLPFVMREARIRFQEQIGVLRPFEGMPSSLTELKSLGYKLGILTSNSKRNVNSFLRNHNLEIFEFVSSSSIFGKARIIKDLLKKHRFQKDEAIYVGDETRDIEAAKEAGIRMISVSWGFNSKEVLSNQNPDFLIDKPEELLRLLLRT